MDAAGQEYGLNALIGASPSIQDVRAQLARAAENADSAILLVGEHGTGKHLAARLVHFNSPRRLRPLVEVTCAGAAESRLAGVLFGQERGAFPDAREQTQGALKRADGGTVLIDEIDALSPALQAKLRALLQTRTFTRAGGQDVFRTDIRLVGATASPLEAAVGAGRFRADLYQSLGSAIVHLPPLRERGGDIALLANHFVGHFNGELRRTVQGLTDEALALLVSHPWPGNVRELRNAIERAMLVVEGRWIRPVDLAVVSTHGGSLFRLPADGVRLEEVERQLLVQALERAHGNQTHAGRLLGLKRDQIRYRMEKFGLPM